ncbi:MAG: DUF1566 domain-containing protein, partial [Spirochaetota bacterium]
RKASRILKRVYEINSNGGLPKTGQSMIYQPGDDGSYQMGYPIGGGQRFIDNGDGTVIDLVTGLMWIKDPTQAGLGSPMYWYDAINACENLDFAGHDDWRLPNINELMSIVDHSRYNPAFDTFYFTPFPDTWTPYWSSTTNASWIDGAWALYPYDGYKTTWGKPWDMCYIRPVRGGQA